MGTEQANIPRCQANTEKRDTYRYSGRGKGGFTLRYTHPQCTRKSTEGGEYCRQHATGRHFPFTGPFGPKPFMPVKKQLSDEELAAQQRSQELYDSTYGSGSLAARQAAHREAIETLESRRRIMDSPQIGDLRINENGAEQVYRGGLGLWDADDPREQPHWQDTVKQLESQKWVIQCTDCNRKETVSPMGNSDEWFAHIAKSPNKAPITYIKECEKCLDDKYGKDED
jgi:hypothetical protein